jgi:hypothetical protein
LGGHTGTYYYLHYKGQIVIIFIACVTTFTAAAALIEFITDHLRLLSDITPFTAPGRNFIYCTRTTQDLHMKVTD